MTYTTIYNDPYSRAKYIEPWVYWDDAFTEQELDKIVSYCESFELGYGTTFGTSDKQSAEDIGGRVSNVMFHERNQETAWIFDRLNFVIQAVNEKFYNFDLNGYYKFQYTTYDAERNGHYDWHIDSCMGKIHTDDIEHRKLSLTLLLNDKFDGGEFELNVGKEQFPEIVSLKKGRIVFFPSFMIHRVAPVTSGTRRSLVVWVLGPKFR
jgi:PKHD-type hydroxylase